MTGGLVPAGVFCLAAGAALGCLFLLCKALRLALGLGPWATALVDVLFCLVCGAVSFLCALAVDQGRLLDLAEAKSRYGILRLLASAMSNAEIARQLFIGEATVKTHVSNLLQKTGSRDRVAAVVWAYRNGVV